MSILFIVASPKKNGNSKHVYEYLSKQCLDFTALFLENQTLFPCLDCSYCKIHKKQCVQDKRDDLSSFYEACFQAKKIIIITPVYFYHLPSNLKAFIDRSQRFWYPLPDRNLDKNLEKNLEKKNEKSKLYTIYIAGRNKGEKLSIGMDLTMEYFAPLINSEFISSLCLYGLEDKDDFLNTEYEFSKKARNILTTFVENSLL